MVKKLHIILLSVIVCLVFVYGVKIKKATAQKVKFTIVLDAGHGGIDGGVVFDNGVKESDLNLDICNKIKAELQVYCINVIMTRSGLGGLYGLATKGFKTRDMQKRKEIILKERPHAVISIHQNFYPSSSRRGAQTFYNAESESGKNLAQIIQNGLNELPTNKREYAILKGDYFLLKCFDAPSVIIECGFLSNIEDEGFLTDEDYQKSFVKNVAFSVAEYFLTATNS